MLQQLKTLNNIPDYLDDRLKVTVILSDHLDFSWCTMLGNPSLISAWYDPIDDVAYNVHTENGISDVYSNLTSDQERNDRINYAKQHLLRFTDSTNNSTLLMYHISAATNYIDTGKSVTFNNNPFFDGEQFKVWWDAKANPAEYDVFSTLNPLAGHKHQYDTYGEHVIAFSNNVTSLKLSESSNPNNASKIYISKIESRNETMAAITTMYYSRKLQHIKCFGVYNILNAWSDCYELTSIELPNLSSITTTYAMNCYPNLKKFIAPKLQYITSNKSTFKGNTSLEDIYFPSLSSIDGSYCAFSTNVKLSSAYCPSLVRCCSQDFEFCINLKKTEFSSLSAIPNRMFQYCISLKEISLPSVKSIAAQAFLNCQNLKKIDLRALKSVPSLEDINAFSGLPGDFKVLVDDSVVDQFKSAPNWSNSSLKGHIATK